MKEIIVYTHDLPFLNVNLDFMEYMVFFHFAKT